MRNSRGREGEGGEGVDDCVVRRSDWVWGVRPGFCFSNLQ